MLEIRLFGTLDVRVDGAIPSTLRNRSGAELLGLLALNSDRDVRAVWAAEVLWPDTGSLDSLRQSIKVVRAALGPEADRVEVRNNTMQFRTDGAFIDVVQFDAVLAHAERGDHEAMQSAIALYKHPLLHGWNDGWVLIERKIRRQRYLDALQELARIAVCEQDVSCATLYLTRLIAGRPNLEWARCELMRALMQAGERLEAIRVYEQYRDHVWRVSKGKLTPPLEMSQMLGKLYAMQHSAEESQPAVPVTAPPDGVHEPMCGPVPLDSRFYTERAGDELLRKAISYGEGIILIRGPRQVGRSSLLIRGLNQARSAGATVVMTDLRKIAGTHMRSIDEFLLALAQMIADQVDGLVEPSEIWHVNRAATLNFERFMRREVLTKLGAPVMWGLCNIDTLLGHKYKDDVFSMLRAWYNEGVADRSSILSRLKLIMDCATGTRALISDLNRSPFNVGACISLKDFTLDQVRDLCRRYGLPADDDAARLYSIVGGHPYLVRTSLQAICSEQADMHWLEGEAKREDGIFGVHLDRLQMALSQDAQLAESMAHMLSGRPIAHTQGFHQLDKAGLIVGTSPENARPRCKLYESHFRRQVQPAGC